MAFYPAASFLKMLADLTQLHEVWSKSHVYCYDYGRTQRSWSPAGVSDQAV